MPRKVEQCVADHCENQYDHGLNHDHESGRVLDRGNEHDHDHDFEHPIHCACDRDGLPIPLTS